MIRIERGREPEELATVRIAGLGAAREAQRSGMRPDLSGYEVVKAALADMQHGKCCYCEKREEQPKHRDVEHYRPRSRYWWLTWTWDNLLFACVDCNREHKRDQFPLAPGSAALTPEQLPPGGERPLVIDPADPRGDLTADLEFRAERVQHRERWRPYGLTERGRTTIKVCGLDRPSLLTLYTDHVVHHVRPKISDIMTAHRDGDAPAVVRVWRSILAPARPFRALSYDALRALIPADICTRYQLMRLRPGL